MNIQWKNLPGSTLEQDQVLLREWDRLNAARRDLPFLVGDVVVCALKILGRGGERLLVGYSAGRVLAMFVLVPEGMFSWRSFQPSQLPLGAWVADSDIALTDLARSLLRGPLNLCLVLSITQIDPQVAARVHDAPDSQTSDYIETGWIDTQGNFDTYWNARGKNLRQNMRKQRAKLQAEGVKLSMEVLCDQAQMAAVIARYGSLESAGWKGKQGTAIHPDNIQGHFYRDLLERASARAEAVVFQYLFDDRVVAMNLCLVRHGILVVLKTTYDESIKSYSPTFLMREEKLQSIFNEGKVTRVEYFGRLMEWHTKFTNQKRALYHLTLYRWPLLKSIAEARRRRGKVPQEEENPTTSNIKVVEATTSIKK